MLMNLELSCPHYYHATQPTEVLLSFSLILYIIFGRHVEVFPSFVCSFSYTLSWLLLIRVKWVYLLVCLFTNSMVCWFLAHGYVCSCCRLRNRPAWQCHRPCHIACPHHRIWLKHCLVWFGLGRLSVTVTTALSAWKPFLQLFLEEKESLRRRNANILYGLLQQRMSPLPACLLSHVNAGMLRAPGIPQNLPTWAFSLPLVLSTAFSVCLFNRSSNRDAKNNNNNGLTMPVSHFHAMSYAT